MLENFERDLAIGKEAEDIVLKTFAAMTNDYEFTWVADNPLYYHYGDIIATDKTTGKQIYIEVKNDSRIADTRNVLCEDEVEYFKHGYLADGNMRRSSCNIYCVVSMQERKIYIIDFSLLKKNYRKGEFKYIRHTQQESAVYLCYLSLVKSWGALIDVVEF